MLWTSNGLHPTFIYICIKVHMFFTLFTLMSCPLSTSWLYSFNYLFCGNVIYGTSSLCSLKCVSCGVVIYGISTVYLASCTTIGTTLTIVGTIDGSILPLIIFYVFKFVLSYSLFTLEPKAPPSSTLFFLLRAFLGKSTTTFLYSSVVCISSLVL